MHITCVSVQDYSLRGIGLQSRMFACAYKTARDDENNNALKQLQEDLQYEEENSSCHVTSAHLQL